MKKVVSVEALVVAMLACFSLYASTADLWLSMALYLGLVSLNVAAHSAAQAHSEASRPEPAEGRAAPRRGRSRRRGSFPGLEK